MDRTLTISDVETLRAEMQVAQIIAELARAWMERHEGRDPLGAGDWRRQMLGAEQILARAGRKVMEAVDGAP